MGHYHDDQPITGAEEEPDRLNREKFAEHLAEILVLKPEDDCLTVSLEGEWGYGKTSVINLVKKYCNKNERKPVIVEYNPWLAGKAEALIQDFLVQFSSQLSIPDRPKEGLKAAKELLSYSKLFNSMKFIPGAEPWTSTVESVFNVVGSAAKKVSKLKELDLLGRKEKVKDVLVNLNQSIIVVIDDIDRLTPDEAFQVVRLIKSVADFPGTSFLLSFDPEYLSSALKRHGIEKSGQYVDKVVQLRVPLPLISIKDLDELANIEFDNLSDKDLTEAFEQDQDRLGLIYHKSARYIIRSPRDLKRIINHVRFVLKQTEGEVCFSDIYSLSILCIKAPNLYLHIKENPAAYVGMDFDEKLRIEKPEEVVESYKEDRLKKLESVQDKDKKYVKEIIEELFPLTTEHYYGGHEFDKVGRVASINRLYVALHYDTPQNFAAGKDVLSFIKGDVDRNEYLKNVISGGLVERFFELLSLNIDKVEEENIVGVLQSIYTIFLPSDYIKEFEEKRLGFFGFEPFRYIRWVTFDLIKKTKDKPALIVLLIEVKTNLPITADILRRLMMQKGEIESKEPDYKNEMWMPDDKQYEEVKLKWKSLAIEIFIDNELAGSPYLSHIYYMLRRVDEKATKDLLNELLNKENGLESVALIIKNSGSDSVNGPYVQIVKTDIEEFVDYSLLVERAAKELETNKEISNSLKAVYKSIVNQKKYYLKDVSEGEDI